MLAGLGYIRGIEISSRLDGWRKIQILAYGMDDNALMPMIKSIRENADQDYETVLTEFPRLGLITDRNFMDLLQALQDHNGTTSP